MKVQGGIDIFSSGEGEMTLFRVHREQLLCTCSLTKHSKKKAKLNNNNNNNESLIVGTRFPLNFFLA